MESSNSRLEGLVDALYADLHAAAARLMWRERIQHTLQPTALVNEAYMRMAKQKGEGWADRTMFLAIAANVMRHVLVDHARGRAAKKRGSDPIKVTLSGQQFGIDKPLVDLIALEDGLEKLGEIDVRLPQVVELRFFGGLTIEETAESLKVSKTTIKRDWNFSKAFLHRQLSSE